MSPIVYNLLDQRCRQIQRGQQDEECPRFMHGVLLVNIS
jgi:hypothetical protein